MIEGKTLAEALLQLGPMLDFVKLLLWTGQLSDERPASAIIVAPAGSGKTTLLENLQCEQATFMGDITARTLTDKISNEKISHILLGDMLSIFGHKQSTVKLTLSNISKLTGEKLQQDPWTGKDIPARMIGLITAIPPADYLKHARHIKPGGFASRFLVIKYTYKASTIAAIHRFIAENGYANQDFKPFLMPNPGRWVIKIPEKLSGLIKDFGQQIKDDPLGFRAHRHLRALVKAQARRNCRPECTYEDFKVIESYCEFFSQQGKEI